MTVPREYSPAEQSEPNVAVFADPQLDALLQNSNALLLGRTERSVNFAGGTATVGPGENVNAALQLIKNAGGGTVFLRPGVYVLTADLFVPSGVALEGASRDNVTINCNTSYSVRIVGSNEYTTGTISATSGDATVTGSGTTWTSAMVGRSILIDGFWYTIATFTSTTSLELSAAYDGTTVAAANYAIADIVRTTALRRITITNATGSGVVVRSALEPTLDDIYINTCGVGVDMDYVVYPTIRLTSSECTEGGNFFQTHGYKFDFCAFEYNTNNGITMLECGDASFFDTSVLGNGGVGVSLTSCYDTAFVANVTKENTSHGVELVSGNRDMQFIAFTSDGNGGDGYKLNATSDRITISSSTVINNTGYGINIAASTCDDNYIIAPSFGSNTAGDINDTGTNTTVISRFGANGTYCNTYYPLNGAATPVAVLIESDGTVVPADANDNDLDEFHGFIWKDYSAQTPAAYLGSTENSTDGTTTISFSHTLQAGTNRVVYVFVNMEMSPSGTIDTNPTGVTWNGNAMTSINAVLAAGQNKLSVWRYIAGTGSIATGNVVVSGITTSADANLMVQTYAFNYQHVSQSSPNGTPATYSNAALAATLPLTYAPTQAYSLSVVNTLVNGSSIVNDASQTTRQSDTDPESRVTEGYYTGTDTASITFTFASGLNSNNRIGMVFELMNSVTTLTEVVIAGKLKGFSGLTPGAPYYLSNTAGDISTTPGGTSIKVGKALSATELVIIQS